MITKMTGRLDRILDEEVRLSVGPLEYQVLVPECVRRQLQLKSGQETTLHIVEYLEGNQSASRFVPRKIGFLEESELDFFELFCTVEKIGAKKALKAMARTPREIADAIARQDTRWLVELPGIGAATAEQIVTTLKRKVAPFLTGPVSVEPSAKGPEPKRKGKKEATETAPIAEAPAASGQMVEDIYLALLGLQLGPAEARSKIDTLLASGRKFSTFDEGMKLIFTRS